MIRLLATVALCLGLAACGADGEPERPEPRPEPGVSVTGNVSVGFVGSR